MHFKQEAPDTNDFGAMKYGAYKITFQALGSFLPDISPLLSLCTGCELWRKHHLQISTLATTPSFQRGPELHILE